MKKKLVILLCTMIVIIGIIWGGNLLLNQEEHRGSKAITITVVDKTKGKSKELYHEVVYTDAKSLDALLKETKALKAKVSTSKYGALIESILNKDQDMDKGPWWVFESSNNKVCKDQGMCPVANQVKLANKNVFEFHYIDSFE